MSKKKIRNTIKEKTDAGAPMGFNNHNIIEEKPKLRKTAAQSVVEGQNNCFQILKRDQPNSGASGYGGKGATGCGTIHLIAGLDSVNGNHSKERDPNFFNDASTVYISQKTKLYKNFAIVKGKTLDNERPSSGIGLKSDNIAVHSRNDLKLVTGPSRINQREKNSAGGKQSGPGQIQLIAGNNTESQDIGSLSILGITGPMQRKKALQPLVKGDNLVNLLDELIEKIQQIQNFTLDNQKSILELSINYASHVHMGVCAVGPVITTPTPSAIAVSGLITSNFAKIPEKIVGTAGLSLTKENYLNPLMPDSITSKFTSTT